MNRRAAVALVAMLGIVVSPGTAHAAEDELQSQQWGIGKIHAPRAWAVTQGEGVVVAVIDTGVEARHTDLQGRVLPGRDFVDDDNDPRDEHGHGTLVAGIIAARRGNGGGVGVAPGATILPVRALDENGRGEPADVAEAIRWSVARGADVINLSLTVDQDTSGTFGGLFTDQQVDAAIEDAADAGVVVLIASGNDADGGANEASYDSDRAEVLVVGASTIQDRGAAYANRGKGLDVVAPGGGSATDPSEEGCADPGWIISTWWRANVTSPYGATCGTSMATAFASGVAALLRARGMDAAATATRMQDTALDLGPAGWDPTYGAGRIDAAAAVGAQPARPAGNAPSAKPMPPVTSTTVPSAIGSTPAPTRSADPSPVPLPTGTALPPVVAVPPFGFEEEAEPSSGLVALAAAMAGGMACAVVASARRTRRVTRRRPAAS